jgi:thioredoxin-dependent peroxiredoxin
MADITFKGNAIHTNGELPAVGSKAPDFKLTTSKLEDVGLEAWEGKKKVITINPSLDTGICQATARAFNEKASSLDNTVVLVVSSDLPFAAKRFCEAEGLSNVESLTLMRSRNFAKEYGVLMQDGPLAGLVARAVLVLDETNTIKHAELVPEIVQEPNYDAALAALS